VSPLGGLAVIYRKPVAVGLLGLTGFALLLVLGLWAANTFTEPVIQHLVAKGWPGARAYQNGIWRLIGLLTPMFILYCIVQGIEEIRQIPVVRHQQRERRAYAASLLRDLARPLEDIKRERENLYPSHAKDGDWWRPLGETERLDDIIAARMRPDHAQRFYPHIFDVYQEMQRKAQRKAMRDEFCQRLGQYTAAGLKPWVLFRRFGGAVVALVKALNGAPRPAQPRPKPNPRFNDRGPFRREE
jgi:hypothetical protein